MSSIFKKRTPRPAARGALIYQKIMAGVGRHSLSAGEATVASDEPNGAEKGEEARQLVAGPGANCPWRLAACSKHASRDWSVVVEGGVACGPFAEQGVPEPSSKTATGPGCYGDSDCCHWSAMPGEHTATTWAKEYSTLHPPCPEGLGTNISRSDPQASETRRHGTGTNEDNYSITRAINASAREQKITDEPSSLASQRLKLRTTTGGPAPFPRRPGCPAVGASGSAGSGEEPGENNPPPPRRRHRRPAAPPFASPGRLHPSVPVLPGALRADTKSQLQTGTLARIGCLLHHIFLLELRDECGDRQVGTFVFVRTDKRMFGNSNDVRFQAVVQDRGGQAKIQEEVVRQDTITENIKGDWLRSGEGSFLRGRAALSTSGDVSEHAVNGGTLWRAVRGGVRNNNNSEASGRGLERGNDVRFQAVVQDRGGQAKIQEEVVRQDTITENIKGDWLRSGEGSFLRGRAALSTSGDVSEHAVNRGTLWRAVRGGVRNNNSEASDRRLERGNDVRFQAVVQDRGGQAKVQEEVVRQDTITENIKGDWLRSGEGSFLRGRAALSTSGDVSEHAVNRGTLWRAVRGRVRNNNSEASDRGLERGNDVRFQAVVQDRGGQAKIQEEVVRQDTITENIKGDWLRSGEGSFLRGRAALSTSGDVSEHAVNGGTLWRAVRGGVRRGNAGSTPRRVKKCLIFYFVAAVILSWRAATNK
ncbi:uncharacterized protein LOC133562422 [Nerophis ophidion]|uniref:uncharacterized protein LOC133562422 n=1 Tax=Nerophis ophidion TaxID=159077 RepID=UPI002ADFCAE2|nr:uncharacterized protein LOC133562422 [Nerophis ophidion]